MKRAHGFIQDRLEIKILILFVLRRLQEPVCLDVLTELSLCDDAISYFDYIDCVSELIRTEHIQVKDKKYSITDKGIRNGEITENSLPFTVRMHIEKAAFAYRSKQDRNSMIQTAHTPTDDGNCTVTLSLSDGIGEIASLNLMAVNEHQALALESGFRKNAESIYNSLIGMILK